MKELHKTNSTACPPTLVAILKDEYTQNSFIPMQQLQLVCIKCGQGHAAPYKSTGSASNLNRTNPENTDMTKKYIMIMICKLSGLCMINNWCIDKASLFKEEVELLSNFARYQGLHDFFPAKDDKVCNIKKLIAQLEGACEKLKDGEETTIQGILQCQISALKVIECKVYSVANETVNETEPEDVIEQDDHEEDDNKDILTAEKAEHRTRSTPINLQIKAEENSAMETVDYQPNVNVHGNAITTVPDDADVTQSSCYDVRYPYRRANKCARCASSNKARGGKDCFFPLGFYGEALDKCINCDHLGHECEFSTTGNDGADRLVSAGQSSKPQYPDHRQSPMPAIVPAAPITLPTLAAALSASSLPTPATALLPSTPPTLVAAPSVPPQAVPAAVSVTAPVPTAIIGNGKRKGASEPRGSSPVKHRRTHDAVHQPITGFVPSGHLVDKTTMLHQVTCLNISLESFTDMSLRQVESDRKHREQEAAFEKHKQAYEESKRVFEERKRAYEESMQVLEERKQLFEDNERLCGESKPIYVATQECLATRAESVGENIIEEANNLLSSIKQRQTLQDIVPAFQRLRTAFGDFIRAQGELSEEHKFKGDRAQILYTLMERIHKAVGIEVLVEGTCPEA